MDWGFGLFRYNKKWKAHRRLFHKHFNSSVVSRFHPQHVKAAHELLYRLAHDPEAFMDHVRLCAVLKTKIPCDEFFNLTSLYRMASSLILNVAYGIDAQSLEDPSVLAIEKPVKILTIAATPGSFLVDSIPIRD